MTTQGPARNRVSPLGEIIAVPGRWRGWATAGGGVDGQPRAVALAAGHRPFGECRHRDCQTYRSLWIETHSGTTLYAKDVDTQLHRERRGNTGHRAPWAALSDGVFVATDSGPAVVVGDPLARWDRHNSYRHKPASARKRRGHGAHAAVHRRDIARRIPRSD